MKTATIEILEEGETIFGSRTNGEYFVREHEDGVEMGGHFFKTKLEAWKYLTIYEEDNPERACRIYDYAEEYVKKYPELDEVPSIFDGEDAIFTR